MPNYIITDWTLICFNHGLVFLDNNYFFKNSFIIIRRALVIYSFLSTYICIY